MTTQIVELQSKEHWLRERVRDLTSTDIAALFGLSPYKTANEVFYEKRDREVVNIKANDRMVWGDRLEEAIGVGLCKDYGWKGGPFKKYMRLVENRIGSSFDWIVEDDKGKAILEIKNVDARVLKEHWIYEDNKIVEAPPHIELQVQHQMLVSGITRAYIGALVGGNTVVLLTRIFDQGVASEIIKRSRDFWERIKSNSPYPMDFEKDGEVIKKLYNYSSPGKIVDASSSVAALAVKYRELAEKEKEIRTHKEAVKNEMLTLLGDAEKVQGEGFTISMNMVGPTTVSYERAGYRNFRIHWRGKK